MNFNEEEEFVPKIDKKEVEDFNISGKDGEKLYFYRENPFQNETRARLMYILRDESFKEFKKQIEEKHLRGEESENKDKEKEVHSAVKASIVIDKKDKEFNFTIEWDYQGNGYGRAIYENYSHILDILGIQDKEQYKIQVANQANHEFLEKVHTEELVARTKSEPSTENAIQILKDFAQYPNTVKLSDVNAIVDYAKKSNVSVQEIAQALNENGFNIRANTIADKELEQFITFGITGLKATCMHEQFMENESFEFLKLITDADKEDTTLEFRRVFEEIKKQREEREKENRYIPSNLKQFGELGYIILDWRYSELLFRDVTPEIQEIVKGQAIQEILQNAYYPYPKNNWQTSRSWEDGHRISKQLPLHRNS